MCWLYHSMYIALSSVYLCPLLKGLKMKFTENSGGLCPRF